MKIFSIDLAIHQTGIAVFEVKDDFLTSPPALPKLLYTATKKETLGSAYKVLDLVQLRKMESTNGFLWWLKNECNMKQDIILVEWNPSSLSHLLEKFTISVVSYLCGLGYHVIPIQANRWMTIADALYVIKRNKYEDTREGNKKWISDLATNFFPTFHFSTQDEKDATVMGVTFCNLPARFWM